MPSTPTSQDTTTVRLPRALVEQVRTIAEANDRSLSAALRVALTEYVRRNLPEARQELERRESEP